ncbi:hypothetical protein [Paenibacillus sp. FSL H8-0079]|uniref:hypothetical protein n=1 Tax=Paenibacillus TaxID=44249 RepID=UPI0030EDFC76
MSFEFDFDRVTKELVSELTDAIVDNLNEAIKGPNYANLQSLVGDRAELIMLSSITLAASASLTNKVLKQYHKELTAYLETQK